MKWLKMVNDNWDSLLLLVRAFHPDSPEKFNYKFPITNEQAELIRRHFNNQIPSTSNVLQTLKQAKDDEDVDILYLIFNKTWWEMPESDIIRNLPGFFVLCDLCSEYGQDEFEDEIQQEANKLDSNEEYLFENEEL